MFTSGLKVKTYGVAKNTNTIILNPRFSQLNSSALTASVLEPVASHGSANTLSYMSGTKGPASSC